MNTRDTSDLVVMLIVGVFIAGLLVLSLTVMLSKSIVGAVVGLLLFITDIVLIRCAYNSVKDYYIDMKIRKIRLSRRLKRDEKINK